MQTFLILMAMVVAAMTRFAKTLFKQAESLSVPRIAVRA